MAGREAINKLSHFILQCVCTCACCAYLCDCMCLLYQIFKPARCEQFYQTDETNCHITREHSLPYVHSDLYQQGKHGQQSKLTYFLWCFEVQSSRKDYVARTETDSPLSLVQAHLLNTWPYFLLQSCPRYHKLNSFWSKNLSVLQVHVRNQLILTVATPESVSWWHDKSKAWCSSLRSKFGESCWCSAILIELSRMLRKVHADTVSGWTFTLEPIS